MRRVRFFVIIGATLAVAGWLDLGAQGVSSRAAQLHKRAIVIDTHDDTPQRFIFDQTFEFSRRNSDGHIDLPRLREGGVDAIFFSIWVPSDYTGPKAIKRALDQMDGVR